MEIVGFLSAEIKNGEYVEVIEVKNEDGCIEKITNHRVHKKVQ